MIPASDMRTSAPLSSDARQAVTSVFEALEKWREELVSVNERHLPKALDTMAASQRALGWPDHLTTAARDHLVKTSKFQTQMISQVMDAWENQLKPSTVPPPLSEAFQFQTPASFGSALGESVADMMRLQELALLAPFRFWIHAAETWQRNWTEAMTGPFQSGRAPPTRRITN